MKRVIEHMLQKRGKDDVIILFDGRSRPARHVFDEYEEKLQCHKEKFIEVWIVYAEPAKAEDPRAPRSATTKYKRAQSLTPAENRPRQPPPTQLCQCAPSTSCPG